MDDMEFVLAVQRVYQAALDKGKTPKAASLVAAEFRSNLIVSLAAAALAKKEK